MNAIPTKLDERSLDTIPGIPPDDPRCQKLPTSASSTIGSGERIPHGRDTTPRTHINHDNEREET